MSVLEFIQLGSREDDPLRPTTPKNKLQFGFRDVQDINQMLIS